MFRMLALKCSNAFVFKNTHHLSRLRKARHVTVAIPSVGGDFSLWSSACPAFPRCLRRIGIWSKEKRSLKQTIRKNVKSEFLILKAISWEIAGRSSTLSAATCRAPASGSPCSNIRRRYTGKRSNQTFFYFFKKSLKPKLSWKTVEGKIAFDGAEEKMYTEGYEVKIVLELAR